MIYSIGDVIDYTKLGWSSDWNGEDVGYDNVSVVGLYSDPNNEDVMYYIDMDTNKILEVLIEGEEE